MRECLRYNQTLRRFVLDGYSASNAHATTAARLEQDSTDLLYRFAFELAISAGTVGHAPIPSFGSPPSDYHGREAVSLVYLNPFQH